MTKIEEIKVISLFTEMTNHSVASELTSLASNCDSIFNCVNMDDLMTQEKKLNKDVTELLPELVKECSKKLEDLQDQLSSMQSEDSDYHEEERRKHHHDDDDDDDDDDD
jgi:hypothetical protein